MASFIFSPTQSIYLPAYNQLQYGLVSSNSNRGAFSFLTTPKVNNVRLSTLVSQQFTTATFSNVDIHRIAQTEISYDINFDIVGATSTPNSIKTLDVVIGETYNNIIQFVSITQSAGATILNLNTTPFLSVGDRIELELEDTQSNQYLNSFWRITGVSGNNITIDDYDYINPGFTQSGRIKEGREFFDASYNNGKVDITTTNAHDFQEGDTFLLQLDTYAATYLQITSLTGTPTINQIQLQRNGITYSLLSTGISGASINTLLTNVQNDINAFQTDFTAYADGIDSLYIYSQRQEGTETIGVDLSVSTTGTIGLTWSQFWKSPRANVGSQGLGGWNSFGGVFKVGRILSSTKFETEIGWQNNTRTGSQRGSIIRLSNYEYKEQAEIADRWLMNHRFQYDDFFTYTNPPLVLTEDPRTCIPFSDWSEYHTIETMNQLGPSGSTITSFLMRITYPLGGSFFDYTYTLPSIKGAIEPRTSFGVGPANLSPLSTTFSTTRPEDYKVQIYDNFGNLFYEKNFCYKCKTRKYYRIKWLNKWGAWDYYDFIFSDRIVEGSKETFYRAIGSYKNSQWSKSKGERGLTVYDNRTFEKFLFYSDLLTREEGNWIVGLFESSEVYLLEGSKITPIIILNEEIFRFNEANKIRQVQFEARLAFNTITQTN